MPQAFEAQPVYTNAFEARLAHMWVDVLAVPAPARDADFFAAGGDSIAVFRMLQLIKGEFGVELSVSEFFDHSVLGELARTIETIVANHRAP